jgi:hypothetical protein
MEKCRLTRQTPPKKADQVDKTPPKNVDLLDKTPPLFCRLVFLFFDNQLLVKSSVTFVECSFVWIFIRLCDIIVFLKQIEGYNYV